MKPFLKTTARIIVNIGILVITAIQAFLAADLPGYSVVLYIPLFILSVLAGLLAKELMTNLVFFVLLMVVPAFCAMMLWSILGLDPIYNRHVMFLFSFPLVPILTISIFLFCRPKPCCSGR